MRNKIITVKQASEVFGIPVATLYRYILGKVLPATKKRGAHKLQYYVSSEDLKKLLS